MSAETDGAGDGRLGARFYRFTAPLPDPRVDWARDAACRGHDPAPFFPEGRGALGLRAKAVCARCPVRPACLAEALACGYAGVWGGTTDDDRARLRRGARVAS